MEDPRSSKPSAGSGGPVLTGGQVEISVFGRLSAEHPIYADIGRVVAGFAEIEHLLDVLIWRLAGIRDDRGACITGQMMGHAPRLKAVAALAHTMGLPANLIARANRLSNDFYAVADKRNRIAHDAWLEEKTTKALGQFRSPDKSGAQFGVSLVDADQVRDALDHIDKSRMKVMQLSRDLLAAMVEKEERKQRPQE